MTGVAVGDEVFRFAVGVARRDTPCREHYAAKPADFSCAAAAGTARGVETAIMTLDLLGMESGATMTGAEVVHV